MKRTDGNTLKTWILYWSPEGRPIATVQARTSLSAIRKAPKPYRKYPGEIYAIKQDDRWTEVVKALDGPLKGNT